MENRWVDSGNIVRLYFLGSKNTADGDCSHEIKRLLLLGRRAMTKLDSILKSRDMCLFTNAWQNPLQYCKVISLQLIKNNWKKKSRDITLPTKVHLVKAMVFPVVMYGCESWTIKKAEH